LFEAVDRLKAEIDKRSNHMKIQNDQFGFLQPSCVFEESKDPNIERGIKEWSVFQFLVWIVEWDYTKRLINLVIALRIFLTMCIW